MSSIKLLHQLRLHQMTETNITQCPRHGNPRYVPLYRLILGPNCFALRFHKLAPSGVSLAINIHFE